MTATICVQISVVNGPVVLMERSVNSRLHTSCGSHTQTI